MKNPTNEAGEALWHRWNEETDEEQKDRLLADLVNHYIRLAVWETKRFVPDMWTDEFEQRLHEAVLKAIDYFDPTRERVSLANIIILEARKAAEGYLREERYPQYSRDEFRIRPSVVREVERRRREGLPIVASEVAEAIDARRPSDVERVINKPQAPLSLDRLPYERKSKLLDRHDTAVDVEQQALQTHMRTHVLPHITQQMMDEAKLSERQKFVITRVFGLDGQPPQYQKEIAAKLGVARQSVSASKIAGLKRLRRYCDQNGITPETV